MELLRFEELIKERIVTGKVLKNVGGKAAKSGDSTIEAVTDSTITYLRKDTPKTVKIADLYEAYKEWAGKGPVTTRSLQDWRTSFHNTPCHCTFFFQVLIAMGIVEGISSSNPYAVRIPPMRARANA